MTMTTKTASKAAAAPQTEDDHKLCDVDVTVGRLVYWDGEQRGGLVHGVPKHIALQWLQDGHAAVVYEPTA
ncbi:hypothetical protein [Mycobacterium sp. AZCC_0083]|uniref:hypothetical protein n=1 Tax=Mycobacterium sp. AZCC_0083 TaxID=2735882 RepID=UPI0017A2D895|nr:hypothetical protein [Mycobacterium sp. AZCC_0083]MBB5162483.1 hypothetical protein [Mycobacterium sp. AZCC_0083]